MIRTIWVWLTGAALTVFYASRVLVRARFDPVGARGLCDRLARAWAGRILRAAGVRVRAVGMEHVDPDRSQIVVSNHESWFDVFALVTQLPGGCLFVAKQELGAIPFFGPGWKTCGHISIDRGDRASAIESLDEAARQIHDTSRSIVIFPEGTRSRDGRLQAFKKGAFVLALKANVPLVPVAVVGGRAILAKGGVLVRKGDMEIRVGEPIQVEGLSHEHRDKLMKKTWCEIARLKGEEALPPGNPEEPEDAS